MNTQHMQILKNSGLHLTPVRLAVLGAIEASPHADADTIFRSVKKRIHTTSKQAIYHNLNTLVDHGIIREIRPKGRPSLYEARIDDNHHHLVCKNCGVVADTDCIDAAPCLKPTDYRGFVVEEAEVVFWGVCPDCQKPETTKGKKS